VWRYKYSGIYTSVIIYSTTCILKTVQSQAFRIQCIPGTVDAFPVATKAR